jgi:hypothetical protein
MHDFEFRKKFFPLILELFAESRAQFNRIGNGVAQNMLVIKPEGRKHSVYLDIDERAMF